MKIALTPQQIAEMAPLLEAARTHNVFGELRKVFWPDPRAPSWEIHFHAIDAPTAQRIRKITNPPGNGTNAETTKTP